ncbi:MAG: MarR family transcriptional regulator [Proteobacteria bacterium]|nr:MarR family transcriptional regulator [Pseudomonadota bacterium]
MNDKRAPQDPFGESIGYLLRRAQATARLAFDATLAEWKINAPQFAILLAIHRDPGQSSADLTRRSTVTAQAVNLDVKYLEKRQLLRRRPHPLHGRILQTELTSEGRQVLKACLKRVRAVEAHMLEGLAPEAEGIVRTWLIDVARKLALDGTSSSEVRPPRSRRRAA